MGKALECGNCLLFQGAGKCPASGRSTGSTNLVSQCSSFKYPPNISKVKECGGCRHFQGAGKCLTAGRTTNSRNLVSQCSSYAPNPGFYKDSDEKIKEKSEIELSVLKKNSPEQEEKVLDLKEEDRQRKKQEQEDARKERDEERRREREEAEAEAEAEYTRTHCVVCKGIGSLVELYGKKFHRECLEDYKKTDKGKTWIIKNEDIIKAKKVKEEEDKKYEEWLKTDEGKKFLLELEQQEAEKKKKIKNERFESLKTTEGQKWLTWEGQLWLGSEDGREWLETEEGQSWLFYSEDAVKWLLTITGKEWLRSSNGEKFSIVKKEYEDEILRRHKEKKLVQGIKIPFFFIFSIVSLALSKIYLLSSYVGIIASAIILILFYKLLTGVINRVHTMLCEIVDEAEEGETIPSGVGKFFGYALGFIFASALFLGIVYLVKLILLKFF
jgi:hypothetical protein